MKTTSWFRTGCLLGIRCLGNREKEQTPSFSHCVLFPSRVWLSILAYGMWAVGPGTVSCFPSPAHDFFLVHCSLCVWGKRVFLQSGVVGHLAYVARLSCESAIHNVPIVKMAPCVLQTPHGLGRCATCWQYLVRPPKRMVTFHVSEGKQKQR